MPHLRIEYSANLVEHLDIQAVCDALHQAMVDSGVFPLGGIRVRAFVAEFYSIADRHLDNAFIDLLLRIGEGRSLVDKQRAGDLVLAAAKHQLAHLLSLPHMALSLEIREISADLSWKSNSIHARLNNTLLTDN